MLHNLQIQKLLVSADTVPSPYEKVKLIKKAINIADAHNDIGWGFDLRKQIIEAEQNTSSCAEGIPAFVWLLETHKNCPEICDEKDFMPEYKWMIQVARRSANVSMQQFESIVEDYKTRLLRNGYSLHSYYTAKVQMAFQQNRLNEAKEYLDLRKSEKRDALSCCVACEIHDLVEYEFLCGDITKAVTVGADIFSIKEYCRYIPFRTVCVALNILNKHGYGNSAEQLFKIANLSLQRMQTGDMSNIGYIGLIIYFLTGKDKNRAKDLFEKYLDWSLNCEDYYNFQFSSRSLSLFKGSGNCSLNINSAIPWYKPSGVYELPELYEYYKNQATTLATKFDARNGNTNLTDELSSID
ncbi:MAG: hypothetical protein LBS55_04860 [Prevotellaceae bacterium]|jgi:hypothetical protein|nr:hypothetical protein [Prevotellaceae bacterium]